MVLHGLLWIEIWVWVLPMLVQGTPNLECVCMDTPIFTPKARWDHVPMPSWLKV